MLGMSVEFLAHWGARLAIASPIVAVSGLVLFRSGVMAFGGPLLIVAVATIIALIALLMSVLALVGGLGGDGAQTNRALLGLVVSLVVVFAPLNGFRKAMTVPPIHDISTDLANPPVFSHVPTLRADSDNSLALDSKVMDLQKAHYTNLRPVTLEVGMAEAFAQAVLTAEDMGWEIVHSDAASGQIEAVVSTLLFGFKDDVAIRLTAVEGGTQVDLRSVSRVGQSDLGANAARIQEFLDAIQ
jgi:uncharacterized protein (DUF1499 family)